MLQQFDVRPREDLVQGICEPGSPQPSLHGRDSHVFIEVPDLNCGRIESGHKVSEHLVFSLFEGEKTVRGSRRLPAGAEVGHERMLELSERVDTPRAKARVPGSSGFTECRREADAEEGIGCPLDHHESLVALQMVSWVSGAVVRLYMRYLEPTMDRLVEDKSGERLGGPKVDIVRRLLTIHLELGEPTVDFFEPAFVVVQPSVLRNPKSRTSRRM